MASHLSTQLLLLVASLVALVLGRKWQARYTNLKYLPKVPGGHWFWGHEKVAWIMPNSLFYTNNFERFGTGIFVMKGAVGQPDILAISDPAAISQIFTKNAYNYVKSPYIRPFLERLVGRGIVWSEGEDHKSQSVALAPVFTHTKLRGHHAEMCASAEKFVGAINDHIDRQESLAAHDGEGAVQVDAIEWANKVTMDIIGRVGLGYDFQLGDAPEAKRILGAFFEAVAAGHTLPGFVAPLVIRAFPFIASLPIKSIQADGVAKLVTRELSTRLIRDRKLLEADGQMVRNDYLSALLRLHGDSNEQSVWDAISDQILAMILANQDDAADILAMAVYTLSRDKDAQERLRNELLSFSASSQGAEPTYDDYLNRLPFLDACIKEILRLYPSVDHTERVALQDDILPLSVPVKDPKSGKEINSVRIRAGQMISVSHSAVQRAKDAWVDPDDFKPDRWFETLPPASKLTKGWNGLFIFGEGPRACIGYRLAVHEIKVVLSTIVRNFELLPVEGPDGEVEWYWSGTTRIFVVGKKEGSGNIPVRIRPLHAIA